MMYGAAAPSRFIAEVWIDADWYAEQDAPDPCPPERHVISMEIPQGGILVGRRSMQRNIVPDIECGEDTGVSRRHAIIDSDGQNVWVEDCESANGTFIGMDGQPLPVQPIPAGMKYPLEDGASVFVGAWTRIIIRDRFAHQ